VREFPPTSELQFLVGREFGQVCLDPFSIQFRFADGGQITVEHRIEHIQNGSVHSYDCQSQDGPPLYLHRLLQQPIISVEAEPLRLTLTFEDGAALRIHSEIGPYECGQIYPTENRQTSIVF
jgi:hypothetical protein